MKLIDLLHMALQNLWQRKLRTTLNLLGIVTGCCVLLMTAAGVRGVRDAFHLLFDSSEQARRIVVVSGAWTSVDPPEEAIRVSDKVPLARRERIREALASAWRQKNDPGYYGLTDADLREIGELPHVLSVAANVSLPVTMTMAETLTSTYIAEEIAGRGLDSRVVAGNVGDRLGTNDVLIHEFLAYRLGYASDADLETLVGRTITITYRVHRDQLSNFYAQLTRQWQNLSPEQQAEQAKFVEAVGQLIADIDKTTLTEEQKQMIRDLLHRDEDGAPEDGVSGDAPHDAVHSAADNNHDGTPQHAAELIEFQERFRVRAIIRPEETTGLANLFRHYYGGSDGELFLNPETAMRIQLLDPELQMFHMACVTVDSTRHLGAVSEGIEKIGCHSESARWILEGIEYQIDRSSWIVYAIAITILLTSAIGISNTLVISVLERTPEFGILKSLGARDSQVLGLMICEGMVLGVVGAVVSIVISLLLCSTGQFALRMYIEREVGGEMPGNLFQFSWWTAAGIVAIAVFICASASLLPAWRAARLDPVVAMRRT